MSRTVIASTAESRLSLSRRIYSTVRERIILGQYPQGSRLPEKRIGEELDVSRVPLREAVPLLERDGFVHSYPRRGAVVARWDAKAIDDLFDARLSLEVGAARYAARQVARGGSMDALNDALDKAQRMVAAGDAYAIARSSTAFHEAVVETSSNELMVQVDADHLGPDHLAVLPDQRPAGRRGVPRPCATAGRDRVGQRSGRRVGGVCAHRAGSATDV